MNLSLKSLHARGTVKALFRLGAHCYQSDLSQICLLKSSSLNLCQTFGAFTVIIITTIIKNVLYCIIYMVYEIKHIC